MGQSRNEDILQSIVDATQYTDPPKSRVEDLLLQVKEAIEEGGGGGGTGDYDDLENKPQIGGVTLSGNKSASDLGLVAAVDGKGLSTNDYTDADKAIVGGVTAALAGKQGALTAGKYIDIDANNEISVEREIPNEAFIYTIQQIGDGIVTITKTVNGAVVFEETYNGDANVTLDALQYVYNSGVQSYTLLIASDTHEAGFKQVMSWWQRVTYTENFSTVDHSGEKLIIKSEMDTALAGKQATLTFDDVPTDNSNNPVKSNGIYDALALKQNATDNSLDTTAKTIVGAINEHEGDIDSLRSGLTNVDAALSAPENSGKNLIPLSLDNYKTGSTTGTWASNVYSVNGIDFTVNMDANGAVTSISASGTASALAMLELSMDAKKGAYTLNGCPSGGSAGYYVQIYKSGFIDVKDRGDGVAVNIASDKKVRVICAIGEGLEVTNLTFYPMLRPATITDPTFAPYIPSVESRIEAVESGIVNKVVTNNLEPSGKVTSVGGNVVRNGQVCFINIGITMSGQETSNWIELGSVPEPAYVVRADFVSDSASNSGTLRIQIEGDGKFKVFYGGAAEYRVVLMYLIINGK